jgi:putative membrane protein
MTGKMTMAAVAALALGAAACKQPTTTVSNNVSGSTDQTDEPGVANLGATGAAPAGMQMNAQQFAETAAGSDLFEIATGKLAQQKGSSAAVKSFGEMLVEEHTKASNELKAAAAKVPGVALPVIPPPELQARIDALRGLSGEAFDRQFIADQTASHQQTLTALNAYAATGEAQPLKEHAAKATGVVQKHLNELGQLQR